MIYKLLTTNYKLLTRRKLALSLILSLGFHIAYPSVRFTAAQVVQNITSPKDGSIYHTLGGKYVLKSQTKSFTAFFGNRQENGSHLVRLEKDGVGFELTLSGIEFGLVGGQDIGLSGEQDTRESSDNQIPRSSDNPTSPSETLTPEQREKLEAWEKELKEIKKATATISAKLEESKKEVKTIQKEVIKISSVRLEDNFDGEKFLPIVKNKSVSSGIDLAYKIEDFRIRGAIILNKPFTNDAPPPREFVFDLKLDGLTYKDKGSGVYYFYNESGEAVFRIPKGYAVDQNGKFSNDVSIEVKDNTLVLSVNPEWLADKEREFPVIIDFSLELPPEKR